MNTTRTLTSLVLGMILLAGGCAHNMCRPLASVSGRACCPPGGAIAVPAAPVPIGAAPTGGFPTTAGFAPVAVAPGNGGCCK